MAANRFFAFVFRVMRLVMCFSAEINSGLEMMSRNKKRGPLWRSASSKKGGVGFEKAIPPWDEDETTVRLASAIRPNSADSQL
ncbi:MAG: hypothetical protein M9941_02540 [Anaerolineae bacterium]|nr:hypothetical protein [Anaerolineae bacterium]MCO5193665.1 hypothetical protein [Anaerolineae bacterium]MCO5196615.1 hypothetical protein [Anaerolineae bacterium]